MAINKTEIVATVAPLSAPWRVFLSFTDRYTHINAYNCALLAKLAYSRVEGIERFFAQAQQHKERSFAYGEPGITNSPFFGSKDAFAFLGDDFRSEPITDTQFYIASNSSQVIVSVRGTEFRQWRDDRQDLRATQVRFTEGQGEVHEGFYQGFQFVRQQLDAYIRRERCPDKEFIVTGHSLGAAIATLVAAYLHAQGRRVMLYTYGSPRVGNRTFASSVASMTHFRIVNGSDIVTMAPLPGMDLRPYLLPLLGTPLAPTLLPLILLDLDGDLYTHCGTKVHIEASSSVREIAVQPGQQAWGRTAMLVGTALDMCRRPPIDLHELLQQGGPYIVDHFMSSYIPILTRELRLVANSYRYNATTPDHRNLEPDIMQLEAEIAQLHTAQREWENRADADTAQATQLRAAGQRELDALAARGISSGPEWDRAMMLYQEATRLGEDAAIAQAREATLGLVLADKRIDLAHYRGVARLYTQTEHNRQRYFTECHFSAPCGHVIFSIMQPGG